MKKVLFVFLVLGLFINESHSQKLSKSSLSYGLGIGYSGSGNNDYGGVGLSLLIGYKRDIWKDRLRLNPNLTVGSYKNGKDDKTRDKYFNVANLNLSLEYDFLRYKAFSLNIETGGLVGFANGLKGVGVETEFGDATYTDIMHTESEFIENFNYGAIVGFGLMISPLNSKYAIKISPVNLHFGNEDLTELHSFISIDIKL